MARRKLLPFGGLFFRGGKQQITAGMSFDVAIITSTVADELIEQGKVLAATRTRTDIAHGGIGIAVPAGAH